MVEIFLGAWAMWMAFCGGYVVNLLRYRDQFEVETVPQALLHVATILTVASLPVQAGLALGIWHRWWGTSSQSDADGR